MSAGSCPLPYMVRATLGGNRKGAFFRLEVAFCWPFETCIYSCSSFGLYPVCCLSIASWSIQKRPREVKSSSWLDWTSSHQESCCTSTGRTRATPFLKHQFSGGQNALNRDGDLSTDDKPHPGRPPVLSDAVVWQIQNAINVSPNISLRALSVACGVSVGTVHTALHKKLQLRKCPCHWVPHDLTDAQKQQRLQISQRNLRAIRRDTAILTRLVTGDESWFLTYDPTQKQQSRVWIGQNDARPQKPRRDQRAIKVMLVLFLTWEDLFHATLCQEDKG